MIDPDKVQEIVTEVEQCLGDVIDVDTSAAQAHEECWTLCIDFANTILRPGPEARAHAKEACKQLGYA